jgi:hypothetical protein
VKKLEAWALIAAGAVVLVLTSIQGMILASYIDDHGFESGMSPLPLFGLLLVGMLIVAGGLGALVNSRSRK